ncbi:SagB family peptide dehydrogenase [Candidatus Halobonum tyrrellensis]|uniref:SagB-type dehydrogenase domain n=1 Tax=Candidatus Halobonum tyrrellensis G22 TaxID=1324957 RepID=V4HG33_9EURY|nr:SagB family peptide dehydrogenase [Candidatus Halobonum tyrrellensis]ESP89675.1 SagB-type dehydrogenase domain [Candidatus Halobonum tyrrellensis G22]
MVDAREYHERTNHDPETVGDDRPPMDPDNRPRPYKLYEDRPRVDLPDPDPPAEPALSAIATPSADPRESDGGGGSTPLDAGTLAALCHYAAGVTKELERRGEPMRFRAASCTGKLYHVDLYAVTGDIEGFDAGPGVYHFDPNSGALDVLREGDYRGVLADASGGHPGVENAPVTFVATSEWWRNAWKYTERTYRHAFWDSGTVLANLLAVARSAGLPAEVVLGFADHPVADLLGVDPREEAPLELVPVGGGAPASDPRPVADADFETVPVSPDPIDYPLIADAWAASALADGDAAAAWRERGAASADGALGDPDSGDGEAVPLDPVDRETASSRPLANTIERRGSLREYAREPISARKFATVLDRALGPVPVDALGGRTAAKSGDGGGHAGPYPLDCYCLVHAVEGVDPGAYRYRRGPAELERVGDTDRTTAARLALGQSVVGDAAVNVYLLADVDALVDRFGDRGYRLAQLVGGVALGRLYLATYAHRTLGGRGFTFFDRAVTEHLSPAAAGLMPMTMFAFGRPE